jgi:hypothetical protein
MSLRIALLSSTMSTKGGGFLSEDGFIWRPRKNCCVGYSYQIGCYSHASSSKKPTFLSCIHLRHFSRREGGVICVADYQRLIND